MPAIGEKRTRKDGLAVATWDGKMWTETPLGPKAAPDWGPGAMSLPDGSVVRYGPKGGATVLRKAPISADGSSVELTEAQGKGMANARTMADAEAAYDKAVRKGYRPASLRNATASVFEGLPFGGLDGMGALIRDEAGDLGRQAELQWTDARLRDVSGANAPEPEVKRNVQAYFPRPGQDFETQAPRTRQAREVAYASAKDKAGPGAVKVPAYPGLDQEGAPADAGRPKVPPAARTAYDQRRAKGLIDPKTGPRGTLRNPFVAVDETTLNRLPKGSYVIAPDGSFGVIE